MKKNLMISCMVISMLVGLLSACAAKQATETTAAAETEETDSAAAQSTGIDTSSTESGEDLVVTLAAAASLEYAFTEKLIPDFEAQNPGIMIEGTYDSSGKLQAQIQAGLDADIFFSAARKQMNELIELEYVKEDQVLDYLENKIVLIVPSDADDGRLRSFEDIADADMIAIGDPESVPVGQYAKEALSNLGIWDGIQDKISLGTNVTEVLNWVAEGSASCGIVYATDAATTDKVKVVAEAPEGALETPVVYPVALMEQAELKNSEAAQKFFDYITSDEGFAVFESYGFADYRNK